VKRTQAQAEAALEKAKADIKNAEDATQKSLCKDAIENAGQALGNAKAELKRLGKLAK
jgi:F0F1-type ATP synthase membrane subunit b/b'